MAVNFEAAVAERAESQVRKAAENERRFKRRIVERKADKLASMWLEEYLMGDPDDGCCGMSEAEAASVQVSAVDWEAFAAFIERVLAALGPFILLFL